MKIRQTPDSSGSGDEGRRRRAEAAGGGGEWTDELMRIVKEPMDHTLDRMKDYSNSMSQLHPTSPAPKPDDVQESLQESYSRSYRQEHTHLTPVRSSWEDL